MDGHENISFVIEGFQCIFFNSDPLPKSPIVLLQQQGFVLGRTPERKYVYIYANQELKIWNKLTLNTWTYFVSSFPDINRYKILCFEGGILNKLFFPSSVLFEYTEKAAMKVKYQDDSLTYTLSDKNMSGNISIHSTPHERRSAEKGASISTGGIHLEITFDEEKEIQTFPEMFGYILNMCQFMAFRRNISFEKITFKDYVDNFPQMTDSAAECYVNYEHAWASW